MKKLADVDTVSPKNRKAWRNWLQKNHQEKLSVWVIYFKKTSGKPSVSYQEAVEEALCFGWIDSTARPLDAERYMQYFTRRKKSSVWSKINKAKVEILLKDGLMTPAGLESIAIAKANGSWNILDEVEELVVPADLLKEFRKHPGSKTYFNELSKSVRKAILQWLVLAKRPETRIKRIAEIAMLAGQNKKPKQF